MHSKISAMPRARLSALSLCLALCFSAMATQTEAASRLGGGSSVGYSRSSNSSYSSKPAGSSYSSYSNTRTSYGSTYGKSASSAVSNTATGGSSARLGGGQTLGVQRPPAGTTGTTVMNSAGNNTLPAPINRNPAGTTTIPSAENKRNWVAPAVVGAAAGAALGYAIGHSGNNEQQQTPMQNGSYNNGGGAYYPQQGMSSNSGVMPPQMAQNAPMPMQAAPQPESGGSHWFLWLLLAGAAFFAWKKGVFARLAGLAATGGNAGNVARPAINVPQIGEQRMGLLAGDSLSQPAFVERAGRCFDLLQLANREADVSALGEFATPEMAEVLRPQLLQGGGNAARVERQQATVMAWLPEEQPPFASMRFEAIAHAEGGQERFAEIWNFQHVQGEWRLAGIEQAS